MADGRAFSCLPSTVSLVVLLALLPGPSPVCSQYNDLGNLNSNSGSNAYNTGAVTTTYTPTQSLNMETVQVCANTGTYSVSNTDIVELYARPPQIEHSTRDKCLVELRGPAGRRLVVYIFEIVIFDHGTTLQFFDDRGSMIVPRFKLDSMSAPKQKWTSQYERLVVALYKMSTAANNYRYRLLVTTDDGPPLEFGQAEGSFYQEPQVLSREAIAGIAVAGGIVFFGLLGLGIYCCVHLSREKRAEKAAQQSDSKVEASTVYSSGVSQVYFPTHVDRYQKSKSYSDYSKDSTAQHNVFKSTPEASLPPPTPKSGSMRKSKQDFDNKAYDGQEEKRTSKAYEAGRPSKEKNGAIPDARRDTLGKNSTRGSQSPTRVTPPRTVDSTDRAPRKTREADDRDSGSRGRQDTFTRDSAARASTRGRPKSQRLASEGGAYEPVEYRGSESDPGWGRLPRDRARSSQREGRSKGSTRRRDDYSSRDTSRDYSLRDYGSSREHSSHDRSKRSQSANGRRDSTRRNGNGRSRASSGTRESTRSHGRRSSRRDRDGYYSDDPYNDYYDDYRPSRRHSRSRSRHTYDDYDEYYDDRRRRSKRGERSPSIERRGRQYSYA